MLNIIAGVAGVLIGVCLICFSNSGLEATYDVAKPKEQLGEENSRNFNCVKFLKGALYITVYFVGFIVLLLATLSLCGMETDEEGIKYMILLIFITFFPRSK